MQSFYVRLLGTGSPKPNRERSGPAQVIMVDETPVLVDCGEGTTRQLLNSEINPEDIKHVLFTHLHSDHVFGYAHFLLGGWSLGRKELTIVGPKGLKEFHEKILDIFKEDIDYRVNTLGISGNGLLDVNIIEIPDDGGEIEIPEINTEISSAPVVHNVTTFGFRFQKGDQAIVISGDTCPVDSLVTLAKGADILIQDAAIATSVFNAESTDANLKKIKDILVKEHCSPKQAGEIAEEAGVKSVVLTHLLPNTNETEAFQEASKAFNGKVIVGRDLDDITI
ncbi:MBL fold metallo-hydrolase [Salicibibacter kimchii]|uniref:MBL fold metallo-hydrolase n=1 Tax=Salicibibacter kimchii TaxID=2099786 RepID=A0A345C1G7_9BACI|nr:MBL fold metallo-hydrolase [Salicibibacter kimchii]AXF57048.1 MBL fold metallo-hydrolase [Salicibibacter kimchii]